MVHLGILEALLRRKRVMMVESGLQCDAILNEPDSES